MGGGVRPLWWCSGRPHPQDALAQLAMARGRLAMEAGGASGWCSDGGGLWVARKPGKWSTRGGKEWGAR